jgi:aminopeptidase
MEKRMLLGAPSGQKLHEMMDKKHIRWCLLGFPVKMAKKKHYIVPESKYETVYINSIRETYGKRTQKLCRHYRKALRGGDKVHITANDGTDLTFSIKGRPVLMADGIIDDQDLKDGDVGNNIPDGEAFVAPLEYSANGKIFYDYVNIPGFGHIKGGIWLHFKKGKVVKYQAKTKKGNAIFRKFLDSNTGDKDRIAELGIGTNTGAKFIGTIIVDEKIYGTIHIAIGVNTGSYHGKNKASSHLDMIKQMKGKQGNITLDGKLIMKNGEPVGKV